MKTSAAIRVNAILEKASKNKSNSSTHVAFAEIFELSPPNEPLSSDAVMVALNELREEIHRVAHSLVETGASNDLTAMPMTAAFNLTSPVHLAQAWTQIRDTQLRPEVMTGWKWIAHSQPAIDDAITPEVLQELETELAELTKAANADGVPQELRAFIIRQAERIRRALHRYRVEGLEPLNDAVCSGIGDLILSAPDLTTTEQKSPATKTALAKFFEVFDKVAKVAKNAKDVAGAYQLIKKGFPLLKHYVSEAIDYLSNGV